MLEVHASAQAFPMATTQQPLGQNSLDARVKLGTTFMFKHNE